MPSIQNNPNLLVQYLQKPASEFTKEDLIRYIAEREIEMVNFRYAAEDGKLKTINFKVTGHDELDMILATGERVDGSSIFSFLEADSSDLYLVPRYKTAFLNPFASIPSVDILCSFYNQNGEPLESSPENILRKAQKQFFKETGMKLKMMGELEFYVVSEATEADDFSENGYQSAEPFTRHENLRVEAIKLIAQCGGMVRFGHAENGRFSQHGKYFEQHEIEFAPVDPEDAADQLIIAKWILRMLGLKYKVNVTFIPKISLNQPGSGMHIHFVAEQGGKNCLVENGELTSTSLRMIAGVLELAPALTAFGNPTPVSYLRFMPGQNVPSHICWGKQNRSTLIRVPLAWSSNIPFGAILNNQEQAKIDYTFRQTIEYRGFDGSANPYLLSAALIVGFMKGLSDHEAVKKSDEYFCAGNLFLHNQQTESNEKQFNLLPMSCRESADTLERFREDFETNQIFPKSIINHTILKLRSFNDKELSENLKTYGENQDLLDLIDEYLNNM
ncbi:glutamine synthetase family protein [Sunxiuqinia dokdonensis]|uniref:Glutamate-ammonia ligase n=1 Tax=Sunxiuqinia dokdonensis TaxID=1409788 RepID=A0A0L8V5T6_9BACT|nr:glutamine synthetase family protein [Sunxiuqinia dokdonensis]KOH43850.1 glutamate-ammonia ligase [Sunxiuqinia dokdonensis]